MKQNPNPEKMQTQKCSTEQVSMMSFMKLWTSYAGGVCPTSPQRETCSESERNQSTNLPRFRNWCRGRKRCSQKRWRTSLHRPADLPGWQWFCDHTCWQTQKLQDLRKMFIMQAKWSVEREIDTFLRSAVYTCRWNCSEIRSMFPNCKRDK